MGGGEKTQKAESAPWAAQQPYLLNYFNQAQNLFKGGDLTPYTGQSSLTKGALRNVASTSAGLADDLRTSLDTIQSTAAGDYLNGNKYLDANIDRSIGKAAAALNSQASRFGRTGSGAAQNALADTAANISNQTLMQNYDQERARQLQAASALPSIAQAQYLPSQMNLQAGQTLEDYANRRKLGAMQGLQNYGSLIQGNYGGTSSQTMPGKSPLAGALGGAAVGGSFLGPVGALGGGLLGFFS